MVREQAVKKVVATVVTTSGVSGPVGRDDDKMNI